METTISLTTFCTRIRVKYLLFNNFWYICYFKWLFHDYPWPKIFSWLSLTVGTLQHDPEWPAKGCIQNFKPRTKVVFDFTKNRKKDNIVVYLNGQYSRNNGTCDAYGSTVLYEFQKCLCFKEQLSNDEIWTSIDLFFQVLQIFLICRGVWVASRITWKNIARM